MPATEGIRVAKGSQETSATTAGFDALGDTWLQGVCLEESGVVLGTRVVCGWVLGPSRERFASWHEGL